MTTRILLVAALSALMFLPASAADDSPRNGNWWRTHEKNEQVMYVIGILDGMVIGKDFSYWGLPDVKNNPAAAASAVDGLGSFRKMYSTYVKDITAGQLADGLSVFYEDYRNRSIQLSDSVWLVLNSISGKSDAEMQKMIENYRKAAK
jgi:hypothetical protein